jgi:hypothetical protein
VPRLFTLAKGAKFEELDQNPVQTSGRVGAPNRAKIRSDSCKASDPGVVEATR